MRYPFDSIQTKQLNIDVFETVYHAALEASNGLAIEHGPYPAWDGSPAEAGQAVQVDMWHTQRSGRYDFADLRSRIAPYGLRNSMLTAQMPTASTAKLLGNFESTEPYTRSVSGTIRPNSCS